jgi:hypothetical protein
MQTAIVLALAFIFLSILVLGLAGFLAWRRLTFDAALLRGLVASLSRPPLEGGPCPSVVRERPAMDAKTRLEFYGGLSKLPQWAVLSARWQAETRAYLLRSQSLLDEGKPEAAHAYAAMARLVSYLAILPESEIAQAQALLKQAEANRVVDDLLAESAGSQRPGRY